MDSAPGTHALAIDRDGTGDGLVEARYDGGAQFGECSLHPDSNPTCEYELSEDAQVRLVPLDGPQSTFAGWSGACTGTGPCLSP